MIFWHLEDVFEGVTLQRLTANPPDVYLEIFFCQPMILILSKSLAESFQTCTSFFEGGDILWDECGEVRP